jgi:Lipase (class 3)
MGAGIGRFIVARLFLLLLLQQQNAHQKILLVAGQEQEEDQDDQLVLNYQYMLSTKVAADLGVRLYRYDGSNEQKNKYDYINVYTDKPDGAMLAARNNRCYVGFQGLDVFDPQGVARENLLPGVRQACPPKGAANNNACCTVRAVIWDTYFTTSYRQELERDIQTCVKTKCTNPDDCLYLTGYSSGGGTAILAAILHHDLKPRVITFGTAKALNPECPYANPKRWVNWVNSRKNNELRRLEYDEYPWSESENGLETFGYMLGLSDDMSGVVNFGLFDNKNNSNNRKETVLSGPWDPINLFRTHRLTEIIYKGGAPGYADRIDALRFRRAALGGINEEYPISTNGYASGSLCTIDRECESRQCRLEKRGLRGEVLACA